MGSRNYSHKLKWRAGDGEPGISEREQGAGGRGGVGRGAVGRGTSKEREALSGWLFTPPSFFIPGLSCVGVHHVMMCNWPVVTLDLYKQISRETCQLSGVWR